jgi:DNA-binding beta-propeller fold protein YncE
MTRSTIKALRVIAALAVTLVVTSCASGPLSRATTGRTNAPTQHTSSKGFGTVSRVAPPCTSAIQPAPSLPAADAHMTSVPSFPFGVSVSPDGRWAFASTEAGLTVFRLNGTKNPVPAHSIKLDSPGLGSVLTPDGKYLLVADENSGAFVVSTAAAESGASNAVLGDLQTAGSQLAGAIEVTVTPDGRFAFVSLEGVQAIAVFDLQRALQDGFNAKDYVGSIPAQLAPVGLAMSPDGRWLYSTSEGERASTNVGSLSVISVAKAEKDPAGSVVARVPAGCNPVRVVTSASGGIVWVTARASDAVLAYSATKLRTDPAHALLADVRVGESPVGLAMVPNGSVLVVADSDRFDVTGAEATLAVVDTADALAGRPALLGYLRAGVFPRDIATAPSSQLLLVSNYQSSQLEAVDIADLP